MRVLVLLAVLLGASPLSAAEEDDILLRVSGRALCLPYSDDGFQSTTCNVAPAVVLKDVFTLRYVGPNGGSATDVLDVEGAAYPGMVLVEQLETTWRVQAAGPGWSCFGGGPTNATIVVRCELPRDALQVTAQNVVDGELFGPGVATSATYTPALGTGSVCRRACVAT